MRHRLFLMLALLVAMAAKGKTLVVYYSYTGNCEEIVSSLTEKITADVLEIEPAEKGLHYEANNYALGTQLLNAINAAPNDAASYPAIDPVTTSLDDYSTVIIVTPLWWSQMAAIMQTYLFNCGPQMAGKNVGLIVSSWSSGISRVESDCKRLVPNGNYFNKSLWINHSNHSNRAALIENWLNEIDFNSVTVETGDVNHDGKIDVSDVTALIAHILGNSPDVFYITEANVNGDADGKIDVSDVTALIANILGN